MSTEVTISRQEAERFAQRIQLDLEGAADRIESAKSKIRTAITERHDLVLGYVSPGAYLADRFSDALSRLGVDARREFVAELSDAGLSTRAIAPVVGVSFKTVARDIEATPVSPDTPAKDYPQARRATWPERKDAPTIATPSGVVIAEQYRVDVATGEILDEAPEPAHAPKVTGLDGKQYTRPERQEVRQNRPQFPGLYASAIADLNRVLNRLENLHTDDRFTRNKTNVAPVHGSDIQRALDRLTQIRDELN